MKFELQFLSKHAYYLIGADYLVYVHEKSLFLTLKIYTFLTKLVSITFL